MNLLTHQTCLVHIANGTLKAQKRLTGISLRYAQWLHCLAYIFSTDDGIGVAAILMQNPALEEVVDEAWKEYQNAY